MERYRLFRKNSGIYFAFDKLEQRQFSLRTRDEEEAGRLLSAHNETTHTGTVNRRIGQIYYAAADPQIEKRTWRDVLASYREVREVQGSTLDRVLRAEQARAMRPLLRKRLIDTVAEDFLRVMKSGGVSVNVFLRRWHNHALSMGWIPTPVLAPVLWPEPRYEAKRAITAAEHDSLLAHITNPEWKDYLQVLWWTGGAQADIAGLTRDRVDLLNGTLSFQRRKLKGKRTARGIEIGMTYLQMGPTLRGILETRMTDEYLFSYLATLRTTDRATYFKRYCLRAGLPDDLTLHCYRYAVCERMALIGFNERFAKALVGHASTAIHERYARGANMVIPSLEEEEAAHTKITPFMPRAA